MTGRTVLVTGGAGFMPSHLVDVLVDRGNKVVILDNFVKGTDENIARHLNSDTVKIVRKSIMDVDAVKEAMEGVDVVIHCATLGLRESIHDPMIVHEVNTTGTLNLLQEANAEGSTVNRFIYISSSEALGSAEEVPMPENHPYLPMTVYGASKAAAELYTMAYLRTYDMPVMVIRPFNMYGPRGNYKGVHGEVIPRFILRALAGKSPVVMGDGSVTRDFSFVTDIAAGIVDAAQYDELIGDTIQIASGQETSIKEIAEAVLVATGQTDLQIEYVPEDRPGDVLRHCASIEKAQKLFNYKPQHTLEEGIAEFIEWIKEQDIDIEKEVEAMKIKNWE